MEIVYENMSPGSGRVLAGARAAVVGRGVVGLSTALVLQRLGVATRVIALPSIPGSPIVSEVAGAFWHPIAVDPGPHDLAALAVPTLHHLVALAGEAGGTGDAGDAEGGGVGAGGVG